MKSHAVRPEVGKVFSRIKSDRLYEGYGGITEQQAADALSGNKSVQELWTAIYNFQDD